MYNSQIWSFPKIFNKFTQQIVNIYFGTGQIQMPLLNYRSHLFYVNLTNQRGCLLLDINEYIHIHIYKYKYTVISHSTWHSHTAITVSI